MYSRFTLVGQEQALFGRRRGSRDRTKRKRRRNYVDITAEGKRASISGRLALPIPGVGEAYGKGKGSLTRSGRNIRERLEAKPVGMGLLVRGQGNLPLLGRQARGAAYVGFRPSRARQDAVDPQARLRY